MSGLGSLLLYVAWAAGLVGGVMTIRAFEEVAHSGEARRRAPIVLSVAVLVSLWLPWVTSANGQLTLNGWSALDAATVVGIVLLAGGIAALAAMPDHGGERRELLSMVLSLALAGIVAGNVLIGAAGGWNADLKWGAGVTLAATLIQAAGETARYLGLTSAKPAASDASDSIDLTAELSRLNTPHPF